MGFAFPVLGAITGAGTSVVAVTAILTDLVPGLQLGWILLLGLAAGVCVVGGKAIATGVPLGVEAPLEKGKPQAVSSRKDDMKASGPLSLGVCVSLFGIYLTALLNPLVLLHGVAWNACWVALGAVVLLMGAPLSWEAPRRAARRRAGDTPAPRRNGERPSSSSTKQAGDPSAASPARDHENVHHGLIGASNHPSDK